MPTYEYRCDDCEHQFEVFQKMSDDPVEQCESCGNPVRRLLFPVAIHFKGSGFYTTDYARKKTLPAANGNGGSSESSSTESAASEPASTKSSESGASSNGGGNGGDKGATSPAKKENSVSSTAAGS
ncbi:MAG: FmdB family zinc ribbon protein [Thermoleophilia bacterium]